MSAPAVVMGIGNPFRRDDGIGEAVVSAVRARLDGPDAPPFATQVLALDGEPTRVVEAWTGAALAVVVDAACGGGPPGSVHRSELAAGEDVGDATGLVRPASQTSSHGSGVAEALALGAALGRLPERVVIYAVEGADFGEGPGLSDRVAEAVEPLAERVIADLAAAVVL